MLYDPKDTKGSSIQSNCLYIQAAGSRGDESTAGIHLRWMLKGPAVSHLPKADYYQGSPEGFNKPDDYVNISRTYYRPRIVYLNITRGLNTVVDSEALWLCQSEGKNFYIYFRNKVRYQQVRNNLDPFSDPYGFIQQYGSNLIEVENKEHLFFAVQLSVSNDGNVKTEIQSVETNLINLPKNTTFRRDITRFDEKIFAENGRSIRYVAYNCIVTSLAFEFYEDFIYGSEWEEIGKFALSLEDDEVLKRLNPDPDNHPVHARWARYNDGEFVNIKNYEYKWNGDFEDSRKQIKDSVKTYLELSKDPQNPLANETYYLDHSLSVPGEKNGLEVSHLDILQMASFDYHVARMLGLGYLDISDQVYSGEQFVYAAQYFTVADLNDGQGVVEKNHIAITLPTSLYDERLPIPVTLLDPVPGIVSADPTSQSPSSLTDINGYTFDGTGRYISLLTAELQPDEPANSPFYYSAMEFSMSDFTYPVHVGIEYMMKEEGVWRIPELPHDPNYMNVLNDGNISKDETVAIAVPDTGFPAFVHKQTKSGAHVYGSYGINWFSRAVSSSTAWQVDTEIKPSNSLLPPSNVNAFLIQKEQPILLTSQTEQDLFQQNINSDKTLIRLTFEYDSAQDMVSYHKAINGQVLSSFDPLPDNEELFADHIEIFFRPQIPSQVFGMTKTVSDLPGNPLISVVTTKDLPLSSSGQSLSPNIATNLFQNYIGGIFTIGNDEFIIQNIYYSGNPNYPTFHLLKKQVSSAFGQIPNIPFDPANFISPEANKSFMIVENMQNTVSWGTVNPHPLLIQIGNNWPINQEEITIVSGQGNDTTQNTYLRKFRGVLKTAEIKEVVDGFSNQFEGLYEIDFNGFTLGNHPQYASKNVQWYRGSILIAKESDPFGEKKILKVIRIDNIANGNLKVFAIDESFDSDPLQGTAPRTVEVLFYPGYRVYLYQNVPARLTETHILPQVDGILEKYSIFGLRSFDSNLYGYKSRISAPSLMFARKIEEPEIPQQPIGAKYATRPDYFGRSTYAFTTVYNHKPFSVTFLRSNDDILLSSLYKQTPYGQPPLDNSVEDIRIKNADDFINDRLLDLANAEIESGTFLFKEYNGYRLPIPNNDTLYENINKFIDDHNSFYQESLPHISLNDINNMDKVVIPADPNNRYSELKFSAFVKQTIQNTYVPLTEIPIIYQHIKSGTYHPIPKAQVIRDKNGILLNPSATEFDMAPMMKILGTAPHKTLFVDFTLDGASTSVYFYSVRETNAQMVQSDLSPAIGPVNLVNSFPIRTPEIKSVIPVLENGALNIPAKMQVIINAYDGIHHIKKLKMYRALNMSDATSVRSMVLVKEVNLETSNLLGEELWTIEDDFSDLSEIPFGDPLYYRVTVEREVKYAEPDFTGQNNTVVTDYAPSEPSKLMVTTMTENMVPDAPQLSYISDNYPDHLENVVLSWSKKVYKGKYHLFKMSDQGNWTEIAMIQSNQQNISISLSQTDLLTGNLPLLNTEGDPIFHHFKVITENTAGMFSTEDNILTIGDPATFSLNLISGMSRYLPYFGTNDLIRVDNLFVPPHTFFAPGGYFRENSDGFNMNNLEAIEIWKKMPDTYILLPEINTDGLKNPHVYNLETKRYGCYYSFKRMYESTINYHFLKNSVKKTRRAGAKECIINLGNDQLFVEKCIMQLKFALMNGNNKGMERICLIIEDNIKCYTRDQILNL